MRRRPTSGGSTRPSRGSSSTSASRRPTSRPIPPPGRSRRRSSRYEARDRGSAAAWTSTTWSGARSTPSRTTPTCWPRGGGGCGHLLVDEVQDVDRSQTAARPPPGRARPTGSSSWATTTSRSTAGGWPTCGGCSALDAALPGLRRVDLQVNHRCPAPVVERAVRLIEHNRERFVKVVRPRPDAPGSLVLAPDASDEPARTERLLRSWPDDDGTRAILARTNRELRPAVLAALALGEPFRAPAVDLLVDDPALDALLARAAAETDPRRPLLLRLGALRRAVAGGRDRGGTGSRHGPAGLGPAVRRSARRSSPRSGPCAPAWPSCAATTRASASRPPTRRRVPSSTTSRSWAWRWAASRADAPIAESDEPDRALEEERRLGYVAWTRARRTLTLSYDPAVPSPFLLEAFSPRRARPRRRSRRRPELSPSTG